ncbi:hypothetical protein RFI_38815, partial [Reticulomyxa filosa]
EIKKSILEIFHHSLHLCSIAHIQKLDAICKDRLTLSFEKNVLFCVSGILTTTYHIIKILSHQSLFVLAMWSESRSAMQSTNLELISTVSTQHNLLEETKIMQRRLLGVFRSNYFQFPTFTKKKKVEPDNGNHRLKTANQQLIVKFLQSCWKLLPKQGRIMTALHVNEFK